MKNFWKKFGNIIKSTVSFIFLHMAYYTGIGITSVIARITGKSFLDIHPDKTSWQHHEIGQSLETMY